jgi:hypothetical protein
MTAWRCSACSQPVDLAKARAHYDACSGGDRDELHHCCPLCDTPTDHDDLCTRWSEVAR